VRKLRRLIRNMLGGYDMARHVHFVGSIALDSVEDVFKAYGQTVKPLLSCPDGEVGGRRQIAPA
jgi:hypothetical protein